ncbi:MULTISPECIES: hypothetical protein [Mammaliicoccus]|uniref:hypothetical protein n=1 Tax=Mammaliicoccus TaxID=2803850 RepID=UPI000D1E95BC|nr:MULTISPECIES: hypothetical protein [Mammaliicoccus]PTJ42846.1 hypothetical protein BUZ98_12905 [Mammaliicoccus sciuri]RIN87544.1 hypothetical protein BU003_13510 [Mammaliicoccus sciuri]RIO14954.1 hypothetical protein BUZ88_13375 [Mammaliicoccus sciuri]
MWISILKTLFNIIMKFLENQYELKQIYNRLNNAKSNDYSKDGNKLKSLSDNIKNFRLSARDQLNLSPEKVDKYLELVDNYQTILGEQIVKEYIQKNQKANSVVDTRINNIDSFITKLEKFKRNCDDYYISKTSSNSNEFENLIRSNAKLFDKF